MPVIPPPFRGAVGGWPRCGPKTALGLAKDSGCFLGLPEGESIRHPGSGLIGWGPKAPTVRVLPLLRRGAGRPSTSCRVGKPLCPPVSDPRIGGVWVLPGPGALGALVRGSDLPKKAFSAGLGNLGAVSLRRTGGRASRRARSSRSEGFTAPPREGRWLGKPPVAPLTGCRCRLGLCFPSRRRGCSAAARGRWRQGSEEPLDRWLAVRFRPVGIALHRPATRRSEDRRAPWAEACGCSGPMLGCSFPAPRCRSSRCRRSGVETCSRAGNGVDRHLAGAEAPKSRTEVRNRLGFWTRRSVSRDPWLPV